MGANASLVVKVLLFPLSVLYGMVVFVRNKLFDIQILQSREFKIPIISVGNITVGGTGKTPHIEYLIELLSTRYKVAVLSRGYKRKSKGFLIANENTPVSFIGDEPWQLKEKYPNIIVAVDSKRVRGITKLMHDIPDVDLVLLDDAYQHRYVKPGINILLIDYNRPILKDYMLPYGWLREPASERYRADMIVISKSPALIPPIDKRVLLNNMELAANQTAYFTCIDYHEPQPLIAGASSITFEQISKGDYGIVLVAGIANPKPLIEKLEKHSASLRTLIYPDHHFFTRDDLKKMQDELQSLPCENKIIVTTEKDVARLKEFASIIVGADLWYYIPIKITFHHGEAELFNKHILHYVSNNNRNSILYKK